MLDELLRSIIEHVMRRTMFFGLYRYRVISQTASFGLGGGGTGGDVVTLQAASKIDGLPDLVALPKAHGLAGTTEHLAPSTLVLVGFEGGNPAAPFVCHVLPRQARPMSITVASVDTIDISSSDVNVAAADTANIIAGTAVYIGGGQMFPAAVGSLTDARLVTLLNAVNSIAVVVGVPTTPPLGSVGSDKVYITTGLDDHPP